MMTEIVEFGRGLSFTLGESLQTLLPILIFFLLFQVLYLRLPREFVVRLVTGLALSLAGLTLFLFGVEYGLRPAGEKMGMIMGELASRWILIPVGAVLGFLSTVAEPAVRVLCFEIEKTSAGHIREKLVLYTLALGVTAAVALGMARVLYGFPIHYLLIPGYLLILAALRFTSPRFTAIAFDSGGVATGPMITTFVVAVSLGAAQALEGRDPLSDSFGLIALVAMLPILVVIMLGLFFEKK